MTTPLEPTDFETPSSHRFELADGTVDVWELDLAVPADRLPGLRSLLVQEERARADRFRFERHRRRHIITWSAVRRLLGAYVGRDPATLELAYGHQGKPSLADDPSLEFNLSHSHDLALFAVGRGGALGIDVESVRALPKADEIARRFFSRRELEAYRAQPAAERPRAFFACWTRKEALVKALGEGLFLSLDRFDVSLARDEPARIVAIESSEEKARGWSLWSIEPRAGFIGALATPWKPRSIRALRAGGTLDTVADLPPVRSNG